MLTLQNSRLGTSRNVSNGMVILVIDDCTEMLTVQKIVLEMEGFEVFTAPSGTKAMEILLKTKMPDLIILDMIMEDMTGAEFLILLEEKLPKIIAKVPIVFFSGVNEIPQTKAVGFIHKPTDWKIFLSNIHRFIKMGVVSAREI